MGDEGKLAILCRAPCPGVFFSFLGRDLEPGQEIMTRSDPDEQDCCCTPLWEKLDPVPVFFLCVVVLFGRSLLPLANACVCARSIRAVPIIVPSGGRR